MPQKRKSPPVRSRFTEPTGEGRMRAFLAEIEAGTIPLTPATEWMATALKRYIVDGADFKAAFELTARGRPPQTSAQRSAVDRKVAAFICKQIEADEKSRGRITRAVRAAAEHFGTQETHIWPIWRRHRQARDLLASFDDLQTVVRGVSDDLQMLVRNALKEQPMLDAYVEQLSPSKRTAFMELPAREAVRIAVAAKRRSLTKK